MARAIWSGSISFGMVSIPVKLYGATESKDIRFHLLHAKDGTRLKQIRWCPTDEAEVPWNETARGYEYAKGQYVVLTDEDFEKLPLPSRHTIDISAGRTHRKTTIKGMVIGALGGAALFGATNLPEVNPKFSDFLAGATVGAIVGGVAGGIVGYLLGGEKWQSFYRAGTLPP